MAPALVVSRGGMGGGARGISIARVGGFRSSGRFLRGGYSTRPLGGTTRLFFFMSPLERQTALTRCIREKRAEESNATLMLHNARNLTESEAEASCKQELNSLKNLEIYFFLCFFGPLIFSLSLSVSCIPIAIIHHMQKDYCYRPPKKPLILAPPFTIPPSEMVSIANYIGLSRDKEDKKDALSRGGRGIGLHKSGKFLGGGYSSRRLGGSAWPYILMTSSERQSALEKCVKETIAEESDVTLMLDNARNLTVSEAETSCTQEQSSAYTDELTFVMLLTIAIILMILFNPGLKAVNRLKVHCSKCGNKSHDRLSLHQDDSAQSRTNV
ncbi:unnamed protein product [Bursaphelenchus okinawaensis]|uniref:Uncharacterized protein n=1 Tax=Bursaphelenchus okinawaensis TaxID=465554 RepID=A0A811L7A5_9BILA|nr:unnamed protein product [Bursaphelenchus okinawaensis]CAG9119339.1 unnamed protein product [Bursaphelenchus okinawaensis]